MRALPNNPPIVATEKGKPMPKYYVNVAMSIRAYGSVAIYGETAEEARKTLTADYIADNFEPHGGGDDDLDYDHPSDISLDGSCHDADTEEDFDFEPVMIPDGAWIIDPLGKAAPDMLKALEAILNDAYQDDDGDFYLAYKADEDGNRVGDSLSIVAARAAVAKAKGGAA
jgi:hypothetical protein